jgi:hypothetical protein
MASSRVETQITWSSASSLSVSSASNGTSDAFTFDASDWAGAIQLSADNNGTPASGDTVDFYVLWTSGDILGDTGSDYDTVEHAQKLCTLDTDCIDTDYEIAQKHGEDAAEAWRKYEGVVWLLTGSKPTGQSAAGESVTSQGTTNGFPIVGKCKHCGVHLTRSRDNDLVHASTYSRDCRITRQAELEDESQAAQPCPQCGGTMLPGKDYGCICHPTDYRAHREERMDHLEECYRSSFSTPEPECYCTRCHNTLIHHLDPAYYNDAKPSDWMTASNLESRIALLEEKVKALEDGYTGWKRGI